jgi:hypothetical protein
MKLNVDINWFQTADSGFAILKHCMSILAVLSQSLLLCWLGERHIQQVRAAGQVSFVFFITSQHCEANLMMFCAESASQCGSLRLQLVRTVQQVQAAAAHGH